MFFREKYAIPKIPLEYFAICGNTTHVKLFNLILYADDTNLFLDTSNLNENITNINLELNNIANWCDANKLMLNLQKTNYM